MVVRREVNEGDFIVNAFILILLTVVQAVAFADDKIGLRCLVEVDKKVVDVSYSASKSKMELTRSSDGTLFGSSFEGRLIISLAGTELLNRQVDATAEEYGVIIEADKLVYANLNIEDTSGEFSKEETFFITFGQSFDESSPSFTTDSKLRALGGGRKFPRSYPAHCHSFQSKE